MLGKNLVISIVALVALLTSVATAAPDFEALGRDTVAELSTGAFDKVVARFDQKMTEALPRAKLAAAWQAIVEQAGAFEAVESVQIHNLQGPGFHLVVLTSRFARRPLNIQITFNEQSKIAGLFFRPVKPE